ncbi:GDSL-type esterase/lipase family protein [Paenibacillus arenilitoris]
MGKKGTGMLLIGLVALLATACGNEGRPPALIDKEPGDSEPVQAAYTSLYETSVFLGDSITEGLAYHDALNEENVLAGAGKTAQFALENVEELAKRKPEHIFIQLGSDDLLWPTDDPKSYSLAYYAQLIDGIKDRLPDAAVTLLSVTPVTEEATRKEPRYRNIGDYNEGLKELAAREDVGYVDLSPLTAEHADLYDADGIHFQAEFYPILLDYLKDELDRRSGAQ